MDSIKQTYFELFLLNEEEKLTNLNYVPELKGRNDPIFYYGVFESSIVYRSGFDKKIVEVLKKLYILNENIISEETKEFLNGFCSNKYVSKTLSNDKEYYSAYLNCLLDDYSSIFDSFYEKHSNYQELQLKLRNLLRKICDLSVGEDKKFYPQIDEKVDYDHEKLENIRNLISELDEKRRIKLKFDEKIFNSYKPDKYTSSKLKRKYKMFIELEHLIMLVRRALVVAGDIIKKKMNDEEYEKCLFDFYYILFHNSNTYRQLEPLQNLYLELEEFTKN